MSTYFRDAFNHHYPELNGFWSDPDWKPSHCALFRSISRILHEVLRPMTRNHLQVHSLGKRCLILINEVGPYYKITPDLQEKALKCEKMMIDLQNNSPMESPVLAGLICFHSLLILTFNDDETCLKAFNNLLRLPDGNRIYSIFRNEMLN